MRVNIVRISGSYWKTDILLLAMADAVIQSPEKMGALTVNEIAQLDCATGTKSTVYRNVAALVEAGFVTRSRPSSELRDWRAREYSLTEIGIKRVNTLREIKRTAGNLQDLLRTLSSTEKPKVQKPIAHQMLQSVQPSAPPTRRAKWE